VKETKCTWDCLQRFEEILIRVFKIFINHLKKIKMKKFGSLLKKISSEEISEMSRKELLTITGGSGTSGGSTSGTSGNTCCDSTCVCHSC
jgi:hypothetical protein